MDSVFLLHLLRACCEPLRLDLRVVTCDHGLRPDSAGDAEWVRHLSWSLGLPCHWLQLEVPRRRRHGESVEMAARRLRHKAFARLAKETGAHSVALGHHLDDQAETVLLRLCRGTGPRGAAGMRLISEVEGMRVVRPLLDLPRAQIESQMRAWGRTWREDASNQDPAHARNRARHRVLPLLRAELNPKTSEHLAAFAARQRELDDWVSQQAARAARRCAKDGALDLDKWRKLPGVLAERVVQRYLVDQGVEIDSLGRERLSRFVEGLAAERTRSRVWRFGTLSLVLENGLLRPNPPVADAEPVEIVPGGGVLWLPLNRVLEAEVCDRHDPVASAVSELRKPLTGCFRSSEKPFVARAPRPGDRYTPLGLKGSAKLSDLFVNARVPRSLRARWPVVTCGDEIVWVPGFRVAEPWKMGEGPGIRLTLRPETASETGA